VAIMVRSQGFGRGLASKRFGLITYTGLQPSWSWAQTLITYTGCKVSDTSSNNNKKGNKNSRNILKHKH